MANPPSNEVVNSSGIAKAHRYGGGLGSYRVYSKITANESAPADVDARRGTVLGDRYSLCRWSAAQETGGLITAFTLHYGRFTYARNTQGEVVAGPFFVEEGTVVSAGEHITLTQAIDGDPLVAYIDGIIGAGTIVVMRKGVSRQT